jgi:hypothetical protein
VVKKHYFLFIFFLNCCFFRRGQHRYSIEWRRGEIVVSARSFGYTVLKAKINLIGNDGGTFAAALVPYVKAPSAALGLGVCRPKWTPEKTRTIPALPEFRQRRQSAMRCPH